jgi:hypothetical protein
MVLQWLWNRNILGPWRTRLRRNIREARKVGEQVVVASILYAIQEKLKQNDCIITWQKFAGGTRTFEAEDKCECSRTFNIICVLGYQTIEYFEYIEIVTAFIMFHMRVEQDSIRACLFRRNEMTHDYVYMVQTLEYVFRKIVKGNSAFIRESN